MERMNKKVQLLIRLIQWMEDYEKSGFSDKGILNRELPSQFYNSLLGIVTEAEEYLAEQNQ